MKLMTAISYPMDEQVIFIPAIFAMLDLKWRHLASDPSQQTDGRESNI
jgi:hypothetical protein